MPGGGRRNKESGGVWGRGCMNIKKASSHVKTEHILNFHSRQHTNCGFKRGRRALSCGKKMRVVFLLRTESDASSYPDDTHRQAGRADVRPQR